MVKQKSSVTGRDNQQWLADYQKETGRDPTQDAWETPEKITIKPIYQQEDCEAATSLPGQFPFLRGPYASMYKGRAWTLRQYAGYSSAKESNAFYKKNLAAGQHGLSVAFDLATHRGYDSDHLKARDDVGMAGVAVDSVEDVKILFEDIPLQDISVSMTMNGAVLPILACYIVAAEEQGVASNLLAGTIQNDILKEFMVRNTYIYPPLPSMRITSDIIAHTARHMPKFNAISISGYHIQEAGATAVQEIAFTLADAMEYVRAGLASGLSLEDFAPRLSFFFGIGMNFFMEVAKLRAARALWAHIMRDTFKASTKRTMLLRTHCQTSGVSLAAQDPYNNVIRTTIEAMAGILGGTQSLHTNALDEAVALPTDFSARIARNTQLILQRESGISNVIDPLAGSYYVESLTKSLIEKSRAMIDDIESRGGMIAAIASGYPKREIEKVAVARQAKIDKGETSIIGVNRFPGPSDETLKTLKIDNEVIRNEQCARLNQVRATRDKKAVEAKLQALYNAARSKTGTLMPAAIEAIRVRATVGEVSEQLERVFGRFEQNPQPVEGVYEVVYGSDQSYRAVKAGVRKFKAEFTRAPRIYVAKLGQDGHDRGARVVASAMRDLGFQVISGRLFQNAEEAVESAVSEKADILAVSSLAGAHRTLVPQVLEILKSKSEKIGVIVGGVLPSEDIEPLREAGVLAVYGPGTAIPRAAEDIIQHIRNLHRRNIPA